MRLSRPFNLLIMPFTVVTFAFVSFADFEVTDGRWDLKVLSQQAGFDARNLTALGNSTGPPSSTAAAAQAMVDHLAALITDVHGRVQSSQTAWTAGLAPADFDEAYTTYCACIRTFARALGALGTSPAQRGQDDNGVMEDSINACEDTVHDLGSYLFTHNIVTRAAWQQTLRAMDALTDATAGWDREAQEASNSTTPASPASNSATTASSAMS